MNFIPYSKLYQISLYQIYQIGPKKRIVEIGMSPSSGLIWKKDRNRIRIMNIEPCTIQNCTVKKGKKKHIDMGYMYPYY